MSTETRLADGSKKPLGEMSPASVLIVDLAESYGGAELRVLQLARALAGRRKYAVAVIAGSRLAQCLRREGLESREIAYGKWDPRIVVSLSRIMKQGGYSVFDAHNNQSQLWAVLAGWILGAAKMVATVHSLYHLSESYQSMRWLYELSLRLMNRSGANFIAISPEIRHWLATMNVPNPMMSVIRSGMDVAPSSEEERRIARRGLGLKADQFAVFVIARLVPVKGHRFLTWAVDRLRDQCPNLRCYYVGDGPERTSIEREIESLGLGGIIQCLGFRDDVRSLLAASDLVCLPSLTEGLPFAVLESAAMARPLLVTPVGSLVDYFFHNENARIVPPADVDALASELVWCADHPEELTRLGLAARVLVEQRFDPSRMIEETLAVYDSSS